MTAPVRIERKRTKSWSIGQHVRPALRKLPRNRARRSGDVRPIRIQRKREKGFRLQTISAELNGLPAVCVTRPGKWGNPFDFRKSECCWLALSYGCRGDTAGRQEASVRAFREWIEPIGKGKKVVRVERCVTFGTEAKSTQIGPRFIVGPPPSVDMIRKELRGKNLACFCALDQPCHADVLLEIANA